MTYGKLNNNQIANDRQNINKDSEILFSCLFIYSVTMSMFFIHKMVTELPLMKNYNFTASYFRNTAD